MKENESYLGGILGGLIGGFIASVPWILMYVYGNMILSLLAIIIAMGVLKGYQICKGKVDNKLPAIITIISLLCVTVSTLIIIPLLLLGNEGYQVGLENLKYLYSLETFVTAITKDYIISVIFTILGISGVISNVKKQINEGVKKNITATIKEEKKEKKKETMEEEKEEVEDHEDMKEQQEEETENQETEKKSKEKKKENNHKEGSDATSSKKEKKSEKTSKKKED